MCKKKETKPRTNTKQNKTKNYTHDSVIVLGMNLCILICLVWCRTGKTTNMEKTPVSEYEFYWNVGKAHFFILKCFCSWK